MLKERPLSSGRRWFDWRLAVLGCSLIAQMGTARAADTCVQDAAGLRLPPGFCATIFADGIGHARHLTVSPKGVVYVNTWSGKYYGDDVPHAGGFLVALQDTTGAGKASVTERFGETPEGGGHGGTGVALFGGYLYAETYGRIVRYAFNGSPIVPTGSVESVISAIPMDGGHPMRPFIIDSHGVMYLDVPAPRNSCQKNDRQPNSPGVDPCPDLATRAGVWRYDARNTGQVFSGANRYATGIRNAEGYGLDESSGRLFVTQHGRDQLHSNWPDVIRDPDKEAVLPSEELLLLKKGGDYGWPTCYYDPFLGKLVLAPEYGGDGTQQGRCAAKIGPVTAFPAHWAPNDMVFYDRPQFPKHYRKGVFIAFHGSWDRAPYAQGGYNVVFQPLDGAKAAGSCEIFASGFADANASPATAKHRPTGLAFGPDGALYVADDIGGRIYRITYNEGANRNGQVVPCPSNTAPAGPPVVVVPDASDVHANTHPAVLPPGVTADTVVLGDRIYHGEFGAPCMGCHGTNGTGSPLAPNLASGTWMWSDGSVAGIGATITRGVEQPKKFPNPMPAMGGARLTPEQVNAVAAYVWTLSHGGEKH